MMKENGGAAFPYPGLSNGMSLRDWFAGQALNGMLSRNADNGGWSGKTGTEKVTKFAYEYADAMLMQRGNNG